MKSQSQKSLKVLCVIALGVCCSLTQQAHAAMFSGTITLSNTGSLPANSGFFLQLANGNAINDGNSSIASNFAGLTAVGSPQAPIAPNSSQGTGDLSGTPTGPSVNDGTPQFSNEFFQSFNPSASTISFNIDTTINGATLGNNQDFDTLSFQLYDNNGAVLATNAADGVSLFSLRFDDLNNPTVNNGLGNVLTTVDNFGGAPITATFASVAAVPEPGTWAMMIIGLGALGLAMRRKKLANVSATAPMALPLVK